MKKGKVNLEQSDFAPLSAATPSDHRESPQRRHSRDQQTHMQKTMIRDNNRAELVGGECYAETSSGVFIDVLAENDCNTCVLLY